MLLQIRVIRNSNFNLNLRLFKSILVFTTTTTTTTTTSTEQKKHVSSLISDDDLSSFTNDADKITFKKISLIVNFLTKKKYLENPTKLCFNAFSEYCS